MNLILSPKSKELAIRYVTENIDINTLDLHSAEQRKIFLYVIETRPHLLSKIKPANAKDFLTLAIEENYKYFLYLDVKQYTEELVQKFLSKRLSADTSVLDRLQKDDRFKIYKSFDEKIVFQYSHTTQSGDELFYFDSELNVPLALKSSFKLTLKLTNALALINKLDLHASQIGKNTLQTTISELIENQYKSYLSNFIKEKNIGYYTLCTSLGEFEKQAENLLNEALTLYGLSVCDFVIKNIAIPKDIQCKIEDQALRIRRQRADIEADSEFAKKALENYEAKLALQEKYPNADHSLTEYEKDLALKRYLIKAGKFSEETVNRAIHISSAVDTADTAIEVEKDLAPTLSPKVNVFRRNFIIISALLFLFSMIIMMSASVGIGCIILGVSFAIMGPISAFNYKKFKTQTTELDEGALEANE